MSDIELKKASQELKDGKELSDGQFKKVMNRYDRTLVMPMRKNKQQLLLCPIGLIGSGKTTVVRNICDKINLLRISTDEIRLLLKNDGFNFERTVEIASSLIEKYIAKGYSVGIDADCISPKVQSYINKMEKKLDVTPIWIHIKTPEKQIVDRMKKNNLSKFFISSEVAVSEYKRRKPLHEKYLSQIDFYYKFNSFGDISDDIRKFVAKVKSQFKIV